MRLSRLLLCLLIASAGLTGVAEAQPCYKQSNEYVAGNFFVKPMTDSTCFAQLNRTLLYYNYKTGDTLFSFDAEAYYPYPHSIHAFVADVLMFDSLLVVSLEAGDVYRILKVDFRGVVSELPTALDSIPLLKFKIPYMPGRKLNSVNDSIFLMSSTGNTNIIYSFLRSVDTVTCVDSLTIQSSSLDLQGDTIILLYGRDLEARFYHVDAGGKIAYAFTIGLDNFPFGGGHDVFYRNGNLYLNDGTTVYVYLRTAEGFKLAPDRAELPMIGLERPLFGNETVIITGFYDEIRIYDKELNLLCHKAPLVSSLVVSGNMYGDTLFLVRPDGISIWIPDTTTTSVTAGPAATLPPRMDVWPNPSASGTITVRSEEPAAAIELTDVAGRIVYRASQPGVGATIIPTALLPAGVYFVTALTAQGILRERVVILRATH